MKRFSLKNKSLGFYLQGGSLLLILISSIIFIALNPSIMSNISFSNYSWLVFLFNILAVAIGFVSLLFFEPIRPIASILLGCGFGQLLSMACYPWTDIALKVFFFSNTEEKAHMVANYFLVFLIIFGICLLVSIVSCFFKTNESSANAKTEQA